MSAESSIRRVAIVGSGTIGASWAAAFASHGLQVTLYDSHGPTLGQAPERVGIWVAQLVEHGLADPARAEAGLDGLEITTDLVSAVRTADWVQESAPEELALKQRLFAEITAACPTGAIIASSSSTLTMTEMQKGATHPERTVLVHPFNPPHLIPGVEVVPGERTAPATVEAAAAFLRAVGKVPIRLKREIPGHLANRLQVALFREANGLVADGVADVQDVDLAVSAALGLRWALMGPYAVFHLGGGAGGLGYLLDHIGPATEKLQLYPPTPMTPELKRSLVEGVQAEMDGRSIAGAAAWRDEALFALLKLLKPYGGPGSAPRS